MPFAPNYIERFAFLTLNQGPAPMLDMWGGPAFHIVRTALRLKIFESLQTQAQTAAQLSAQLKTDERGLKILLNALTSMDYLKQHGETYQNTALTKKWLLPSGELNIAPFFMYWGAVMNQFMPHLEESLLSGKPPLNVYEWLENQPEVSGYFQQGMIEIAKYVADDIAKKLPLPPTAKRILDVGGGHGTYSIAMCRRQPALSAVIFDGAQALVTGQQAIAAAHMQDRISTQVGNFITDDLPTGFDVALVYNIVHGFSPDANRELFRKIKAALNSGGQIVVLEQIHNIAPLPMINMVSHILSVAYYHLLGGQVYSYEDIHGWLVDTGYTDIRKKTILKASSALISGTTPSG